MLFLAWGVDSFPLQVDVALSRFPVVKKVLYFTGFNDWSCIKSLAQVSLCLMLPSLAGVLCGFLVAGPCLPEMGKQAEKVGVRAA